ncbi:hypothetical protein V8C40DRAFT_260171 [Trichoderma camerunense]
MYGFCNKAAVKANVHEPALDLLILIYWMVYHFCRRIQQLKQDMPNASQDQILFKCMVDRWGFPIVPWVGHAFKASLCKLQDHGIAMKCGLLTADGEEFDPLTHIDLDKCTMTIDSWITNKAMTNYSTLDVSSVRRLMSNVPIWHSNWRVDLALGDAVWAGVSDQTITPIPPSPAFNVPLVPIAPWVSGVDNNMAPLFKCGHCKESFDTAGCLINHCRLEHGERLEEPANETQDADVATAYWATKCEDCGKDFGNPNLPKWPEYDPKQPQNIVFREGGSFIENDDYRKQQLAFWGTIWPELQT